MAAQGSADAKCVCRHSFSAHGLRGDPGCSFCSCRHFERPVVKHEVKLGKYPEMAFELLTKHPDFHDTPKDALVALVKDGHGRMFAPGAYLVHKGDKSHHVFVVLSGAVTVEPQNGTGHQAGAGQLAGDLRAFTEDPRWASVYADNALALELDVSKLRGLFAEYPDLFLTLTRLLAKFSESAEEVVNATVMAALEQHSVEVAQQRRDGLDPDKAMAIAARWRKIKEDENAADRAREAARAAIDAQTGRRPQG
jgi:CRP-like cAMP-binding protein